MHVTKPQEKHVGGGGKEGSSVQQTTSEFESLIFIGFDLCLMPTKRLVLILINPLNLIFVFNQPFRGHT